MDKFNIGKELIKAGFLLIPLYGINEDGYCTCFKGTDCTSPGKHPIETGWQHKTITTIGQLEAKFQKYPQMNLGIVTGGDFFVVDVDPKNGGMKTYEDNKALFPETLTVITGSGGLHLYYLYPKNHEIGNKTELLDGIDIRGNGGYVVAPGSKHKSGQYYRFKETDNEK